MRVSAKRERTPEVLEVEEMQLLLAWLGVRERAMVFLDMPAGLRRGELAGLKWEDVDFKRLHLNVNRSLVDQHVGPVKTEVSRKLMPIDEYVARELVAWYEQTPYKQPSDYLWATDANRAGAKRGKQPVWLSTVMRDHIQPVAKRLGIRKRIGWHTFRHTFSTLLKSNGEDVKVVQELLRHSTSRMTLDTYAQALGNDKRAAPEPSGGDDPAELVPSLYRGKTTQFLFSRTCSAGSTKRQRICAHSTLFLRLPADGRLMRLKAQSRQRKATKEADGRACAN